ncbi:MAG: ATP-dependent helicase HrpB [Thermodesulfobacteriota bacterium]
MTGSQKNQLPTMNLPSLPINTVLAELCAALAADRGAVLVAPPGSGKTTIVPLALLEEEWLAGRRIIILEPRRLAARAAARRMSDLLGQKVGDTVGYRIRFERKISARTRIEVVTEGILSRMLQDDPELSAVGMVIFDEYHERTLHADLALALCLDARQLRDDLRVLIMSATLDSAAVAGLLGGAPVIRGEGRCFPVTTSYLARPKPWQLVTAMASAIRRCLTEQEGDILAFLPGSGEIRRLASDLADLPELDILPLYGDLPQDKQDKIFAPAQRRRLILATPIAETSLTVEGVTVVVDSGLMKRPRFDPSCGLTRLETVPISKASAEQRAGRAGRLGPGHTYRLWSRDEHHSLADFQAPEIIGADLAPLLLDLGIWGVRDPGELSWLDPPRSAQVEQARSLLTSLGALDSKGLPTTLGKRLARLPLHPRLGLLLVRGEEKGQGSLACDLAALLANRDILKGEARGESADLERRLAILDLWRRKGTREARARGADPAACRRVDQEARMYRALLKKSSGHQDLAETGNLLAHAYPDRLAQQQGKATGNYLLATGRRARLQGHDPLISWPMLVIPDLDAGAKEGRIFLAASLGKEEIKKDHPQLIEQEKEVFWNQERRRVEAEAAVKIGSIVLERKRWQEAPAQKIASCFLEGVKLLGPNSLPWTKESRTLQTRVDFLHEWLPEEWPTLADEDLFADLAWLAPYVDGMVRAAELKKLDLFSILSSRFSWQQLQEIDRLAPSHLEVASGSRIKLRYEQEGSPVLAVRLQEMFGMEETPTICRGKVPVLIHLLSPAQRPIQVTQDLKGFWHTTYQEVKKELKGRYPKHYWPDDPLTAQATSRVKRKRR